MLVLASLSSKRLLTEELGMTLMAHHKYTGMWEVTFRALWALCSLSAVLLQDHPRLGGTPGA